MKLPRILAAICAMALAGCTLGPKYHPPTTPTPDVKTYKEAPANFKDAEGWKVANPSDEMLHGKWWEIYKQPELNALEEQLDINNQNIKQYFQNFMQARTLIAQARSQYWPVLTTGLSATFTRSPSGFVNNGVISSNQAKGGGSNQFYSFPLDASWAPDLWGKIRNQVREAQYASQVSAAELENERLTEQASLAQYYFEIRGQDALEQILQQTVEADKKTLELSQGLYETGISDYISVVQARTALQSAQATQIALGNARAQYEHAIAVLVGKVASEFSIPVKPMLTSPPPIPIGVPSQLLERRPDIAAAERTLAQDNALIGIGYGAFFPQLTISAGIGFENSVIGKLLTWPSHFWSIGPALSQTIFNGGLYRAELNQYTATYNANLAAYRQTVLTAFQQVEDYLASVRIYSQQIQKEQEALKSAAEYLQLELVRYETGVDPYVNVLVAQTTLLSDQQSLATSQISQMVASVSLIEALGGGWDKSQLPNPSQVSEKPAKGTYTLPH
jgi:NodT family efflux transporter outer membrane factor (OMF) lipoprotein